MGSMLPRVTSLEQLSLAEFSGEQARPKVYENGHKNVLVIWLDLVSNAKLYIPSTLNIALLQWHTHLNVCAVK